jgi:sensor histidine kinase YesM
MFESGVFEAHFYNTKEANYISSGVGGIGLKNIKRRFELIYPRNYELHIQDRESEFIVDLKIQLHG